jgi:hypothetical protein
MKSTGLKKLITLGAALAFSISALIPTSAATMSMEKEYAGYLTDVHCWTTGKDDETGKVDVKKNPEKHTTSCLKMDMCKMDGFGIVVKQSNGTYKLYKFDKAGNNKASAEILLKTKKKFDNKITVKGIISGDTIKISSIKETVVPVVTKNNAAKDYVGYLTDKHCWTTGKDDETGKVDVRKNPEKHTTSCLKMEMCMMDGLGIAIKESNGTYKFYKFDKAGSKKADDEIMMKTKRKFGNKIAVKGTVNGDTITITSIKEVQ